MLSLQVASPMYKDCVLNRVNALWCQDTALSSAAQDHHAAATVSPVAPSKARSPSIVVAKSIIINTAFDLFPNTTEAAPLPAPSPAHVPASPIAELHTPASLPTTVQTARTFSDQSATETSDEDSSHLLPTPCLKFQALSSARLQQRDLTACSQSKASQASALSVVPKRVLPSQAQKLKTVPACPKRAVKDTPTNKNSTKVRRACLLYMLLAQHVWSGTHHSTLSQACSECSNLSWPVLGVVPPLPTECYCRCAMCSEPCIATMRLCYAD